MERGRTSPIVTFALAAIVVVCSLPMFCMALNSPPPIQSTLKVSQYTKPEFINLVYIEHKNADTSMANARDNLSVAIAANNTRQTILAYNSIAWSHFCRNNFDNALSSYLRVMEICDSVGNNRGLANSCHNISNTLVMLNRYNDAIEYEHKAMNTAVEINDEVLISKIGKTLGLMCITHHLYNQAAEHLDRSLDIDTRMSIRTNNHSDDIAYDYMYMGLADYRKALDTHNDSLLHQAKVKNLRAYKIFKSTGNSTTISDACKNLMSIYLRYAQTASGSQRQSFLDSCLIYHDIGLTAMKNLKSKICEIDYMLWESKYALITKDYATSRKKLEAIEAAMAKEPLQIFNIKYGYLMASYHEAIGNYRKSFEWANWGTKVEKRQLNREFAVMSAQLSLKSEQDNILLRNEIDREHEYIKRREQEIRLVVITASTVLVLILITVLVIVIRNSLKRKKRLGRKLQVRNEELESQRDQLECINDQIASSINFAHHLQTSMLPTFEQINDMLGPTLILWRPLDLVSGDFYWATQCGGRKLVTIADCTGHGVSGGFMSMLGISILSDITMTPEFKNGQMSAGNVLDIMRDKVVESLRQSEDGAMALDGMDMAVCIIDEGSPTIQFAGAFRPMLVHHKGNLVEYKGDRMPISFISPNPRPFNTVLVDIEPGDTAFIYSDGITDQFGYNEDGEQTKFAGRRLKKILTENADKPIDEIQKQIETAIDNWRAPAHLRALPQIDDIILLGIRF